MGFDSCWVWQPDVRVTASPDQGIPRNRVPVLSEREYVDSLCGI